MASQQLAIVVSEGFAREYRGLVDRAHELAAPLSDEQFWRRPFPFGNSFEHLALHLTGNLNYYIGAQVANNGYVRDRDREFAETDRPTKIETLKRLDAAVQMVVATAKAQTPEDWTAPYTGKGEPDAHCRFDIFMKCAIHLYHHVGQMVFLAMACDATP